MQGLPLFIVILAVWFIGVLKFSTNIEKQLAPGSKLTASAAFGGLLLVSFLSAVLTLAGQAMLASW